MGRSRSPYRRSAPRLAYGACLVLWGCGPSIQDSDQTSTVTTRGDAPSTAATPTTAVSTTPVGSTTSGSDPSADESTVTTEEPPDLSQGVDFVDEPDVPWPERYECNPWAQDCPLGDKCTPWSNDGGEVWNSTRCTDLDQDPGQVGDHCYVEGNGVTGIDTCDLGAMCWAVDPKTNEGTCVSLCTAFEQDPECPNGTDCILANDGHLPVCLPTCDPLLGDCPPDQACIASFNAFACTPAPAAPMQAGEPCTPQQLPYACDSGLTCLPTTSVGVPCDEAEPGCCTAYCDLSQPDPAAPCAPGQVCVSYWGNDPAPIGFENVGACVQP